MEWDASSISQERLQDLRKAAEAAWGDDTRAPDYQGHPQPSAGQCHVTSKWLTTKLGGHVGIKDGHYFWVSPDKKHIVDLTGDQCAKEPITAVNAPLDDEDEPYEFPKEHSQYAPGPVVFTRATHPLYKDFRIKETPDHPRSKVFARRANAALEGRLSRTADLMGDALPAQEPQAQEDFNNRYFHDTLSDLQMTMEEPENREYRFFYGNGQLHVSPIHDHEELRDHAGVPANYTGPVAVGFVHVKGGSALWSLETNIALRGLVKELKDYCKTVGWQWGGLVGGDGQPVADEFGAKKSMWYALPARQGGVALGDDLSAPLSLSERPLRGGRRIEIVGGTAYYRRRADFPWIDTALGEWADDFGLRLAEYPGGTDMGDRVKNKEWPTQFDRGNPEHEPEQAYDGVPQGELSCGHCKAVLPSYNALVLHMKDHEPLDAMPIEDGHFPAIGDMDDPLPARRRNTQPTAMPLASVKEASFVDGFDLYSKIWGYDKSDGLICYGGYLNGQLAGYGIVRPGFEEDEIVMIYSAAPRKGVGQAIMNKISCYHPNLVTYAESPGGEHLVKSAGMVNVKGHLYRRRAGQEPKDLIQAPVPFIYDIKDDYITIGHPGMRGSDIMQPHGGQFTPGGIVEGIYEPGGKMVIQTATTMPFSTYHMMQLWYWSHPQMEITSLELENQQGETKKLAATSVGSYIKSLTATDPVAWNAYQALRSAGGQVYVVGGAVRDALLGRESNDIDLMVAGLPSEQVLRALKSMPGEVILTGQRFGVYRYKAKGHEVEVALPRTDDYGEGGKRADAKITVDPNMPIEHDLMRRDFTANSMAVNLDSGQLIDPYGGSKDIENHVLRTTHPDSFSEDPTRLVRALTATSRYGLNPDERTRQEMGETANRLDSESPDALKQQLDKLLSSGNPAAGIRLAQETGVLHHLFPELANNWDFDQNNFHHNYTLGEHILHVFDNTSRESQDPDLRLAALLHDIGKPASEWKDPNTGRSHYYPGMIHGQVVGADHAQVGADMAENRLRETFNFPVSRIRRVHDLISKHMFPQFGTARGARKFLNRAGDAADDLLTLRKADMTGKGQSEEEVASRTGVERMRELVEQARGAGVPTDQTGLSVNGNDLLALGLKGPQIGVVLRQLVNDVVDEPQLNQRDLLIQRAKEYANARPE